MINEAQLKKMLETLFGCGMNFSRAMTLSKIKPASGRAPGWIIIAIGISKIRKKDAWFLTIDRPRIRSIGSTELWEYVAVVRPIGRPVFEVIPKVRHWWVL